MAELRAKLDRRGYGAADVEAALGRLQDCGYLDDAVRAAGLVRARGAGRGRAALRAEMTARGIAREVAQEALDRVSPEQELAAATRLAARGLRPGDPQEAIEAMARRLLRRGFAPGVCWAACRAAAAPAPDSATTV